MAATFKKNGVVISKIGRPPKGALSSYPKDLVEKIKKLREKNEGWGAASVLDELEEEDGYDASELPSISSVKRYFKECGLIKNTYEPHGKVPITRVKRRKQIHDLWEVDAQGAVKVKGIGYQAMINMKDSKSLKYCMSFPVSVKHQRHQPSTRHYLWAFRLAFEESGLPKAIQLDKDSVFYENHSKSPFPSRVELWLTGFGIKVHFIKLPPPLKQAKVERSHRTMDGQTLRGQTYKCWKHLFQKSNKRRKRLNEKLPCASLNNKAPLEVFPQARHSGRFFSIEKEYELFDVNKIYALLDKYIWYRTASSVKTVSLGANIYYLKKAAIKSQIKITFSKRTRRFIFRDVNERLLAKLPPKGLFKQDLIGASVKQLMFMKYKLKTYRDFPLKT